MPTPLTPLLTADGSHTIKSPIYEETYHSIHGAIRESEHVFIQSGIDFYLKAQPSTRLKIFEMGMGTGLNVYLSYLKSNAILNIDFTTIELHPIEEAIVDQLNYPQLLPNRNDQLFKLIHTSEWNQTSNITDYFTLTKYKADIRIYKLAESSYDIIFYDAFGPKTQSQLWEKDIMQKIYDSLVVGGVFVTYCAMGQLKRDLRAVGFEVQSIPGPPGKREMTRAIKI